MNQLCKVCGEPAAGFHFGAFTCEGCKSFFGRTYNNLSSISECKNNGECVINKKNRTACKACRLRKCILVGMSKSGSRYGRRSNWFKIHCLLQEQQQAGNNIGTAASLLRPHPYLSPLFRPTPSTTIPSQDSKSSESDSGASSADIEDDSRLIGQNKFLISPGSDKDYFSSSSSKMQSSTASDSEFFARKKNGTFPISSTSPASLPAISPSGLAPKWMPTLPPYNDPASWRDLWLRIPPQMAAPAPGQDQPIDLSLKSNSSLSSPIKTDDITINIGETVKAVPLDLTLNGQTTNV